MWPQVVLSSRSHPDRICRGVGMFKYLISQGQPERHTSQHGCSGRELLGLQPRFWGVTPGREGGTGHPEPGQSRGPGLQAQVAASGFHLLPGVACVYWCIFPGSRPHTRSGQSRCPGSPCTSEGCTAAVQESPCRVAAWFRAVPIRRALLQRLHLLPT